MGRYPTRSIRRDQGGRPAHAGPSRRSRGRRAPPTWRASRRRCAWPPPTKPRSPRVYKVHDELTRELFTFAPDDLKPRLAERIRGGAILGLAAAEAGRTRRRPVHHDRGRRPRRWLGDQRHQDLHHRRRRGRSRRRLGDRSVPLRLGEPLPGPPAQPRGAGDGRHGGPTGLGRHGPAGHRLGNDRLHRRPRRPRRPGQRPRPGTAPPTPGFGSRPGSRRSTSGSAWAPCESQHPSSPIAAAPGPRPGSTPRPTTRWSDAARGC